VSVPHALALIPAGLAFILYLVTCSPTVNFTDSGELITVAWTGGIAHPPGYPLYTLLGIAFVHLPFGDPAWRMNILSALFAAAAVGLFYCLVTYTLAGMPAFHRAARSTGRGGTSRESAAARSTSNSSGKDSRSSRDALADRKRISSRTPSTANTTRPDSVTYADEGAANTAQATSVSWSAVAGGLAAAGLLAVSLTFWNWATQAKFYPLHYAFVAGLFWIALRARRLMVADIAGNSTHVAAGVARWPVSAWSPAIKALHLLAFMIGLSLTNHFLTFLLLPGLALLLLSSVRNSAQVLRRIAKHAGTLLIAGFIPLLLYLYLPLRAAMHPLIAWGLPDTWSTFWRQVTAQSYQGLFGTSSIGNHLADAFTYTGNQFGPWLGLVVLVPVVAGLGYLWSNDNGLLAATVTTALISLLAAVNYSIREIATYYVPFYMMALVWAGLGVAQGVVWVWSQLSLANDAGTTNHNPKTANVANVAKEAHKPDTDGKQGNVGRAASIPWRNVAISLSLGALLPLAGLITNWGAAGHRDNYTAELFVRNAFKTVRPNAVVLSNYWDLTSANFYVQHVLHERPDVTLIDKSLLRQPFYVDYLERNYPDLISKNAGPFAAYKSLLNQWVTTGSVPRQLPTAYTEVLNGFIDTNLGSRPVYADFIIPAGDPQEQEEVHALLGNRQGQLVPDGYGYRIATSAEDMATQDPQFDLRGVASQKVPLDEIEASVVALYPRFLQEIGTYMQSSKSEADKQVGARLLAQAQELQPLTAFQDERPRRR